MLNDIFVVPNSNNLYFRNQTEFRLYESSLVSTTLFLKKMEDKRDIS